MKVSGIEIQAYEDDWHRLERLCLVVGYMRGILDATPVPFVKGLHNHIAKLYDHKGYLDVLWSNYQPELATYISLAWEHIGHEPQDNVTHHKDSDDCPDRPEAFRVCAEFRSLSESLTKIDA